MFNFRKIRLTFIILAILSVLFLTAFSINGAAMVLDDDSSQLIPQFEELVHITDTGGDTFDIIVDEDLMIAMDMTGGLEFYDIADLTNPVLLSSFYDGGQPHDIYQVDDLLFLADHYQGLEIYNISNPNLPVKLGAIADVGDGEIDGVFVLDNKAFVAEWHDSTWDWSMKVINVTDPTNPQELTEYTDEDNEFIRFFVEDNLCYTACLGSGLKILNVTDISNITELAYYDEGLSYTSSFEIVNDLIYLTDGGGLQVLNISNTNSITKEGEYLTTEPAFGIDVEDSIVYLGVRYNGVILVNATDPDTIEYLGNYPTDHIVSVVVQDDVMFITMHGDGLKIVKITWTSVTEDLALPLYSLLFFIPMIIPIVRKRK